jgi:hypothetical protein
MTQYLLSTYAVDGEVPGAPRTPDEMRAFMERVMALVAEMDARGTFAPATAWSRPTGRSSNPGSRSAGSTSPTPTTSTKPSPGRGR